MFWVCLIIVIVAVVLGSIANAFHTTALGALGILLGFAIVVSIVAFLIHKLSKRYPKFGEFIGINGFRISLFTIGGGIFTAIIGAFADAGLEVRSYTNLSGETVYYHADAISPLLWVGIVIALIGVAVCITSFVIVGLNNNKTDKGSSQSDETTTWTWDGFNKK